MVLLALLFVLLSVPVLDLSVDTKNITATPGEDVTLPCQGPRGANFTLVEWSRPDLKSNKYVLSFREHHLNGKYQLSSYRGRVNLSDPEMKDGNVSVVVKNVSVNDTGRYECRAGIRVGEEPELYSPIQLTVLFPDPTAEDQGRNQGLVVGLVVAGVLIGISIICFISCIILKRRNSLTRSHSYKVPAESAAEAADPFTPDDVQCCL